MERSDESMARIERTGLYAIRAVISIRMDGIAGAADVDMCRSSAASFVTGFVEMFTVNTIK